MFAFVTYGLEPGPVSRAVNGTEVRLVNDHHAPVAMGEIGELVQPQRYHRLRTGPGLLEDATKDGWFYTAISCDKMKRAISGSFPERNISLFAVARTFRRLKLNRS